MRFTFAALALAPSLAAALALGGCHHAAPPVQHGEPMPAKRAELAWGIEQGQGSAELFVQVTDETGSQVSHPLGTFQGTCAVIKPDPVMSAASAVACTQGASTVELDLTISTNEITVQRSATQQGVRPDPMARAPVTTFTVPLGAAVTVK